MPRVTRIIVRQNGSERKLLKIEEGTTGKLTITGNVLNFPGSPYPGQCLMKDKLSVHLSENARTPIRSLHATQTLPGGRPKHVRATLPIFSGKDFIYPVMARIVGNLTQNGYEFKEVANETIVPLKGYNPLLSTMIIFCMITEKKVFLPSLYGLRKTTVQFSKFNLVFYHTFAPYTTPVIPVFYNFSTEPPIIDGVPQPGKKRWIDNPVPIGAINSVLTSISNHMIDSFLAGAAEFHAERNEPVPYPPRVSWQMQTGCQPFDLIDIEYGVHGDVILRGDIHKIVESISKRVAYSRYSETSLEDAMNNLDAWNFADLFSMDDFENAIGGDVKEYLKKVADQGIGSIR